MLQAMMARALLAATIWGGGTMTDDKAEKKGAKKFDLTATRVFDATPERVWKAWTDEAELKKWWGPTGFSCPVAKVNFKVGEATLICMRAPKEFGGQDMYNTWTYTRIVPNERIEFTFGWADKDGKKIEPTALGLPPEMPREVKQVITLKPTKDGKTEMTMVEYGYPTEELLALSKAGLDQCLDKMAATFAKP
ncbi:MAG TPA: SRPBCC domain-containing protein [Planctomycetia bacterium]|nr:SRPBCC domain-containing protein [Planctomycetia bacterium]